MEEPEVVEALSLRGFTLRVKGAEAHDGVTVCPGSNFLS